MMGSARWHDSSPPHEVEIREPFFLGKYPVTQLEWGRLMGSNPSHFKGPQLPVENVNLDTVLGFIKKLGEESGETYTLPSEAQWEFACRAGTQTPHFWGDDPDGETAISGTTKTRCRRVILSV